MIHERKHRKQGFNVHVAKRPDPSAGQSSAHPAYLFTSMGGARGSRLVVEGCPEGKVSKFGLSAAKNAMKVVRFHKANYILGA